MNEVFPQDAFRKDADGTAYIERTGGLTKRELFAAMAMQGMIDPMSSVPSAEQISEWSVQIAEWSVQQSDALIKALEGK